MADVKRKVMSFKVLDYELPGIAFVPEKPKMGFILWLYGGGSNMEKHSASLNNLAEQLNIPVFSFDYAGHGKAPFDINKTTAAQHFLEVITVYDQLCAEFGCSGGTVIGGSYGAYMLLQLLKYRLVKVGVLRVPALLKPSSFYTHWELIDRPSNLHWQNKPEAIKQHPLIARASENKSPILIVEHENDKEIPPVLPRTLHERLANSDYILFEGVEHSLSTASQEQKQAYEAMLVNWLKDKV